MNYSTVLLVYICNLKYLILCNKSDLLGILTHIFCSYCQPFPVKNVQNRACSKSFPITFTTKTLSNQTKP